MSIIDVPAPGVIKQREGQLSGIRNKYRDRAREYAKVTIPSLLPETELTDGNEFQHDYNTEGAKLVNSLANTYVETLFPAGHSFVKLDMEEEDYAAQEQQGNSKANIQAIFATIERDFRKRFEGVGSRSALLDTMLHLIVTGNACPYKSMDGNLQTYAIDEYVVLRSPDGMLLELITTDKKLFAALDPEIKAQVQSELNLPDDDTTTILTLYTWVRRDPEDHDKWYVDQALDDTPVGEQNTYTTDTLRWFPAVWRRTRREMYGRGLVEDHFGSLWTMSILSEALAVGGVAASDIKYLVRPGSLVNIQELNSGQSGSFHYGEADDINEVTSGKARDLQFIQAVIDGYRRHLSEVFMYLPGTMRNAERVNQTVIITVALYKRL
jgi:hypothetical protein